MAVSTNLGITLLEVAQSGKEVSINTGLNVIDAFLGNPIFNFAVPVTTQRALVQIGAGGHTGGAGHFAGVAAGTALGINMPSGFAGDLMQMQVNGVAVLQLTATGSLTNIGQATHRFEDSGTTNVATGVTIEHRTSGTAAAGFGVQAQFRLENGSGTGYEAGTIQVTQTDATNGSEDTAYAITHRKAGASFTAAFIRDNSRLTVPEGIGVGNSTAASALGAISRVVPIYDTDGTTLRGYAPLYATFTP